MAIGNPTTQPGGLEEPQDSPEAMEESIADLMEQFGEPETGDELDCGVDAEILDSGLEELGLWVRDDEHGVLRELVRAYLSDEGKLNPNSDLTADMFQVRYGCETLEADVLPFTVPWIIARAIGDSLFVRSRGLARDMHDAAQEGDMEAARDLCHEAKGLEVQAERWWDTSHRAFNRLQKAFLLSFQAKNAETLPVQGR